MDEVRCRCCGSLPPRFVAAHEVVDLAADVLEATTADRARDLLVGRDGVTAARVAVALAVLVRRSDREGLAGVVSRLRHAAQTGREVEQLDEVWQLPPPVLQEES